MKVSLKLRLAFLVMAGFVSVVGSDVIGASPNKLVRLSIRIGGSFFNLTFLFVCEKIRKVLYG